ncbi:MAG TPA: NUDIX domain-containing protein [Candidatus Binatia bacterium]|nr:NUDIX domain-containing protein [Candidatus Binatia bacterium]
MAISEWLREVRARAGSVLMVVPSAAALVYDDAGRVLLVRHSNGGVWLAPGGAVDPDESPQDAVVREVWEETGLLVEPVRLCGVFGGPDFRVRYANGDEVAYVMSAFECRRLGGDLRPDGEETLDARFVAPSDVASLPLSRWAKALLPDLVRRRTGTWIPPVAWRPPASP